MVFIIAGPFTALGTKLSSSVGGGGSLLWRSTVTALSLPNAFRSTASFMSFFLSLGMMYLALEP
jgi:hypothetical protein